MDYRSDPSFSEPHRGPRLRGAHGCVLAVRDPSLQQIAAMAAAIRKAAPRPMVGSIRSPWTVPVFSSALVEIRESERY